MNCSSCSNYTLYTDDSIVSNNLPYRNVNANFRAFDINYDPINSPPYFKCHCYFDLPGQMPPYYGYVPPREGADWDNGRGSIVKIDTKLNNYFCYKYNGSSGGGGSCPVGHPSCSNVGDCSASSVFSHCVDGCCASLGSKSPSKSPVPGTKSPTVPGTKAPTKPAGSCPVGHPSCSNVGDCSASSVFSHCVDGCCASLGSKSAKKAKSSKRV
jgi:hypothetical protein